MPLPMTRKSPRRSTVLSYQRILAVTIDTEKEPIRVDVHAGAHASSILIGDGISDRAAALLDGHGISTRRFIVSNPAVWRFHGAFFNDSPGAVEPILIPDGERFK